MSLDILARTLVGGQLPPQTAGVYVLAWGRDVVYVGSSRNILARIGGHATNRLGFDGALWLELSFKTALRYEGALIRALSPPLNDRMPAPVGSDRGILESLGLPPHEDEAAVFAAARRQNGQHQRAAFRRGVSSIRNGRQVITRSCPTPEAA